MQAAASRFTYKGVSVLPLFLLVPLIILNFSPHWSYDESTTYVKMLGVSPARIIAYENYNLANNHVLTTLYYWCVHKMGAQSLFIFRLPSLLMFFVYFWLISKLLKEQKDYQLRHIDQLMLYLWPFSIYFAQARGYAIAMVSFMGCLLLLKFYLRDGKLSQLFLFVILGCISSLSIFSFVFPFIAMTLILGISRFMQIIKSPLRILILALAIPMLLYIFDKGQIISKNDPAIIGRDSLFRGGTLSSLISFLTLNEFAPRNLFLLFKVIFTISLLPVLFLIVKRAKWYLEATIIVVTLLLFVFSHYVLGAQYPIYRAVAYLIILFLLCFAYSNFKKSVFFTAHFSVVIFIGCVYLGIIFYYHSHKSMNDVMDYVAANPGALVVEEMNQAPQASNQMMHNGKLDINNNCIVDDYPCFDNALDTVRYVICRPHRIVQSGKSANFEPVYKVATYFDLDKVFYKRKE